MAAQLHERGRIWRLVIPRWRASLIAGLLLPAVLAVGAIAGPNPAAPIQQATHGHTATLPTTVRMIGGHLPLALTPAVPVLSVESNGRHLSQSSSGAAGGRVAGSGRSGPPGSTGQYNGMGQCRHQPPAYRPGRVFAKGRADSQSGGPVAATPPDRPSGARPPGGVAAARQARPEVATTPRRPEAATRRGLTTPPAVHVSPTQPTAGSLMQGIPQTQRQAG
jgi:hypothetical protein